MSIQRRIVRGDNVMNLSHLTPVKPAHRGEPRKCCHCGHRVNDRTQEFAICCCCEDKGLPAPMPQIEMVVEPLAVAMTEDVFRPRMSQDELREALQMHFGSMGNAGLWLGLGRKGLYNYTSKKFRDRWRALPQKHVDRLNAYVRGEVQ